MTKSFQDYFSGHAKAYASYRPTYPRELFEFLNTHTANKQLAWDYATGNGQVAIDLADYFEKVYATDASEAQIAATATHPKITYVVAPAEKTDLQAASVDLITVAQAFHWFDMPAFFTEARRVLTKKGLIAIWGYHNPRVIPELDQVLDNFYYGLLQNYWPSERNKYVDTYYKDVVFPFKIIPAPTFTMEQHWNFQQFLNYLNTWSAIQLYEKREGHSLMPRLSEALAPFWVDTKEIRTVKWPVFMYAGFFE